MSRSRKRLADFEARSVQIIAACTLGLAGISTVHAAPISRAGAHAPTLSTTTSPALPTSTRTVPLSANTARTGRP